MGCLSVLLSVTYNFMAFKTFGVILENFCIWATNHLGNPVLSAPYFTGQLSMAFLLFGYFLFLPTIISFLFFNPNLQRVYIQRTSSSSQYLINPEKLPSHPVLTVSYKDRHPERVVYRTTVT